jgi:hypothetical protein
VKDFRASKVGRTLPHIMKRFSIPLAILLLLAGTLSATVRNVKTTCGATGNGSTDDTAAINTCIGQLVSGDTLLFPAGTYKVTSTPTAISVSNVTIDGSGNTATVKGTFAGPIFRLGSGSITASTPLLADAAVGDTTFTVSAAAIGGVSIGNYILLQQGGIDSSTGSSATQCDISGCRGEVVKVAGVSGNTITVTTSLHVPYNVSTNAANAVKLTSVISGGTLQNITFDGSGTMSTGLNIQGVADWTISGVTAQNFVDGAIVGFYGFNDTYSGITITKAGSHASCAFNLHNSGHMTWTNITLSSLNSASPSGFTFGWCANTTADNTGTNISVDLAGASPGRAIKFTALAYSTFNGLSAINASAGANNGISLEYYSAHDTFNNCIMSADNATGFTTFGNYNDFTTLNNCTMTVGTGNSVTAVNQAASFLGRRDQNLTITGGRYSGTSGFPLIDIAGDNTIIQNATFGPGSAGIDFIVSGLTGACINNNTFGAGLSYAYASNGASGLADGNVLNGNSVIGPLPTGTCGASGNPPGPASGNPPAPPTRLTAVVN